MVTSPKLRSDRPYDLQDRVKTSAARHCGENIKGGALRDFAPPLLYGLIVNVGFQAGHKEVFMSLISLPYWHPSQARGFILDWDGVIADTSLDFSGIRKKYFNGERVPLIEAGDLLDETQKENLWKDIYDLEMEGASLATPIGGIFSLVEWLHENSIPWAVVSRNCMDSIQVAAERIGFHLPEITMSRDEGPQKPDPAALLLAARKIGVSHSECVMVGDFLYDMVGARRSGMRGVLVERTDEDYSFWADACFSTVSDMVASLKDPVPMVPWEYHSLVKRKGKEWLEKAWKLNLRLDEENPRIAPFAFTALSLGIGRLSVDPAAKVTMEHWENWPGGHPAIIDMPLASSIKNYVSAHYPLASVHGSDGGIRAVSDVLNLEKELEGIIN